MTQQGSIGASPMADWAKKLVGQQAKPVDISKLPAYSEVHVVLIGWQQSDIPGIAQEFTNLDHIFRVIYGFNTISIKLPSTTTTAAEAALRGGLSTLYNSVTPADSSLVIVYYGGHGFIGPAGELMWTDVGEALGPEVLINWTQLQESLQPQPRCSQIQILDCCNAATAIPKNRDPRNPETLHIIAASRKDQLSGSMEEAFSKALTVTLQSLNGGPFTASSLFEQYMKSQGYGDLAFEADGGSLIIQPIKPIASPVHWWIIPKQSQGLEHKLEVIKRRT